ncbi:MAG TPA: O-antigen ligase family protein, partial [Thermoanaerobaculia bacterium]|nr:O-antigen ligase family protein [Thermoanaerobaculia bacterium]
QSQARTGLAVKGLRAAPSASEARVWARRFTVLILAGWASSAVIGFERAVLLLSILGLAAAAAGLRRPILGLYGIGMLCTLDVLSRVFIGGLWRWNTFNYFLLFVLLLNLPNLLGLRGVDVRLFELFVALLIVELVVSEDVALGAQHVLDGVALLGLLLTFRKVRLDSEVAYGLAFLTGVLGAVGGLAFFLVRDSLPYINPNAWSFFPLTPIFASCLAIATGIPSRRRTYILLSLTGVNGLWIFLSGSRGGLLMTAVCLIFLLFQQIRLQGRGILGLVLVGALVLGVGSLFVDQESRTSGRLKKLFDTSESITERTSGRSDLALGAWYIFLDHPAGVGTGGFGRAWARLGQREGLSGFDQGDEASAHSGWAKTLAENGLPGVVLLAAFVASFAFVGWRKRGRAALPVGLLVAAILSFGFLVNEFQGKGLWFLVAGVMALLRQSGSVGVQRVRGGRAAAPAPHRTGGLRHFA